MKKEIIGIDTAYKRKCEHNAKKLKEILSKVFAFFDGYNIAVDKEKLVKQSFVNYFSSLYAETHAEHFPQHMSALNRVKFHQIDISKLSEYQEDYNKYSNTPFDVHTLSVPDNIDYGIYAEGEDQVNALNKLKTLAEAFELTGSFIKNDINIHKWLVEMKKSTKQIFDFSLDLNNKVQVKLETILVKNYLSKL